MPLIGMGIAWFGYTVGLWGYCLIKGYSGTGILDSVALSELVVPSKWPGWPPAVINSTGTAAQNATATAKAGKKVTLNPVKSAQAVETPHNSVAKGILKFFGGK